MQPVLQTTSAAASTAPDAASTAPREVKALLDLSDDSLETIFHAQSRGLFTPHDPVALASTCRRLRKLTAAGLEELRRRHEAVKRLSRKAGRKLHAVPEAKGLHFENTHLTVADCRALADVIATEGLPKVEEIRLHNNKAFGVESMQALAESLRRGDLPCLKTLSLVENAIGEVGASALGAALGRGALPRLQKLRIGNNGIGDAGLVALAPALRAQLQLKTLGLYSNGIGDDGVAALVAPGEGVLPSLKELDLDFNQVGDAGCSALAVALWSGVLPSLTVIHNENPASESARAAVDAALLRPDL